MLFSNQQGSNCSEFLILREPYKLICRNQNCLILIICSHISAFLIVWVIFSNLNTQSSNTGESNKHKQQIQSNTNKIIIVEAQTSRTKQDENRNHEQHPENTIHSMFNSIRQSQQYQTEYQIWIAEPKGKNEPGSNFEKSMNLEGKRVLQTVFQHQTKLGVHQKGWFVVSKSNGIIFLDSSCFLFLSLFFPSPEWSW